MLYVGAPSLMSESAVANSPHRRWLWLIVLVAMGLRLWLAWVNFEANDHHLPVVRVIVEQHRMPEKEELWEAFQPKLYHMTVAMAWRVGNLTSPEARIRAANLINVAAGGATLWIVWNFLLTMGAMSERARLWLFALVALNPQLIGINSQAVNDSFAILFSSAAIYFGARYLREQKLQYILAIGLGCALAMLSKGNTLVTAIAVMCGLSVLLLRDILRGQQAMRTAAHALLFIALFLGTVTVFGPYLDHYEKYGSPFVTNFYPDPKPLWFEKTPINHPGVRSIADAYFAFRFVDMLRHPHNTRWSWSYPEHRTSLWSQIYGQTVSSHFASSPPSWHTDWKPLLWADRSLLILALPFALCFVVGFARALWKSVRAILRLKNADLAFVFLSITAFGYLAFAIVYTSRFREFSTMKAIFVYPAGIAFLYLASSPLSKLLDNASWSGKAIRTCAVLLLVLSVFDCAALAAHLANPATQQDPFENTFDLRRGG
jgi:hypothetical protein